MSIFGTDGVRGRANVAPMTAEVAMKLAMAAGRYFTRGSHRAVIGKDTRLSGYMLEGAMQAGFTATGMDVIRLGPAPTPAVGMLTRSLRADIGVMISASHNPYTDNGIKFFGPDGFKLSDRDEAGILALMDAPDLADAAEIGRARHLDDGIGRYIEIAKATFPKGMSLAGMKVVVDCAHGAAYKTAPTVLWELGAEVIPLGVEPDGLNINEGVGSTAPQACIDKVLEVGADIGIALDGDADRLHVIDETGAIIDGDQILALIADRWLKADRLAHGGVVATVMSNMGLERHLEGQGVFLRRTPVGDRHVVAEMRQHGFNVGGEQSGHVVLTDYVTTGDGLIAALQALAAVVASGRTASEVCRLFDPWPQLLQNVRFNGGDPLSAASLKDAIAAGEARLGDAGRLLIRKSGTEPLIRVMGEGEDESLVREVVEAICAEVEAT
ncbi:MAG: phosphoglucosamine mutase [Pseudomonadota bacterium]